MAFIWILLIYFLIDFVIRVVFKLKYKRKLFNYVKFSNARFIKIEKYLSILFLLVILINSIYKFPFNNPFIWVFFHGMIISLCQGLFEQKFENEKNEYILSYLGSSVYFIFIFLGIYLF
ncbi:DUF4181 domain-containing protein [Gottfriedia sp. NPDC057991]|uniref:DUF4181 domain-containing protein n=1 Tax=Gottfriedia sp. NPDC057991 TaxID=3346298 RepID=UPI0036DEB17E